MEIEDYYFHYYYLSDDVSDCRLLGVKGLNDVVPW